MQWEHSQFVTITINVATGWLFEHGYAKEAARYFQTAGNSFRTMLKKLPCRCMLQYQDKRGMLSITACNLQKVCIRQKVCINIKL